MSTINNVSLSIVIISHNQKNLLKRCIDSILEQETSFPVEIIVSDDRSSDGTREMLLNEYESRVITTFFDSDNYETSYVLERAALNRINGLKLATGKYLIHIDGDDFFTGTDVLQVMVNQLEEHPECSLCCQNYYTKTYDDLESHKTPSRPMELFRNNPIISGASLISDMEIGHNSSFCMRRSEHVRVEDLTSTTYDDIDITLRYLGDGKVALINKCDFVYVLYPSSSSTSITTQEKYIMYNSYILGIPLAPALAGTMLREHIRSVARIALEGTRNSSFPERMITYCRKVNLRIFQRLNIRMRLFDRFIYALLFLFTALIIVCPIKTKGMIKLVYKLAINKNIAEDVVI